MQAPSANCFSPVTNSKMSKVKKILAEANAGQCREIDLVDQNIGAIEECPSLSEFLFMAIYGSLWADVMIVKSHLVGYSLPGLMSPSSLQCP